LAIVRTDKKHLNILGNFNMPPIWQPQSREVYQHWIDTILEEASDELNDWESSFIANIQTTLSIYGKLTEAQAEKLENIYAEKTP